MGYITTFTTPDCTEADDKIDTYLPLKTCVNLALFTSFQGGMGVACNEDKTPKVTAYTEENCEGTAVDAGEIPADYFDGPCQEIVVEVDGTSVSVGGYSASFACV